MAETMTRYPLCLVVLVYAYQREVDVQDVREQFAKALDLLCGTEQVFAQVAECPALLGVHIGRVLFQETVERVCSHVVILHRGRVVADDSIEHLRTLMVLSTLEEIFSQLAVEQDTVAVSRQIADLIQL